MQETKITIHENNIYEEQAKEFYASKKARQLENKYKPLPYEEEYKPLYYLALLGSYVFNGISIFTASTWVFSFFFSILHELPYPTFTASCITLIGLVFLEFLQRFCGTRFFRSKIAYNRIKHGFLCGMVGGATVSISLSFFGGLDVVKVATTPPIYEAPILENIQAVESKYQVLINDAEKTADNYYQRRKYAGRIATEDAKKYQEYLDKKIAYQDSLLVAVDATRQRNEQKTTKAKAEYKEALAQYENRTESKGTGLGGFAVVSSILMYLCLWYMETYDFNTVSQYAQFKANNGKTHNNIFPYNANINNGQHTKTRTLPPYSNDNDNINTNYPIGFYTGTQRKEQLKELYIQDIQPYIQEFERELIHIPEYVDKYTVEHRNFKTGELEHLDFKTVENRASIYVHKINSSVSSGNFTALPNQYGKLKYWREKRQEFFKKQNTH